MKHTEFKGEESCGGEGVWLVKVEVLTANVLDLDTDTDVGYAMVADADKVVSYVYMCYKASRRTLERPSIGLVHADIDIGWIVRSILFFCVVVDTEVTFNHMY